MTTTQIVLVVLIVVVALGVVALLLAQHRRRTHLQEQFGPEYDRAVEGGDRREAERDLRERAQRREELDIRPLPARERAAFAKRWRATQADFVDQPSLAIQSADLLVTDGARYGMQDRITQSVFPVLSALLPDRFRQIHVRELALAMKLNAERTMIDPVEVLQHAEFMELLEGRSRR